MSSRTDLRVPSPADVPSEPETAATNVTRTLSAFAHLNDWACDLLREHFRIKPYQAAAPSYSVDAIAVVGHARSARRHQLIRDVLLLGLLAGMVFTVWSAPPPERRSVAVVVIAAVLIGAWAIAAWIRRSMKQETIVAALKTYYAEHRLSAVGDLSVILLTAAVLLALALTKADLQAEIIMLAICLGAAWVVIAVERYVSLYLADQVTTGKYPASRSAAALPAKLREAQARIHSPERNLIVYNSSEHFDDTFVGSGIQLQTHTVTIDVSKGREDKKGVRLVPKQVDVVDLHRGLQAALLSAGVSECWGGHRMYVAGGNIHGVPLHEGKPLDPLDAVIDQKRVLAGLHSKHPLCRTYLCIQITTWDGELVVTLFVRATLDGTHLHVLYKTYVLAPLRAIFPWTIRQLPRSLPNRLYHAASYATQGVIPRLLRSPQRCAAGPRQIVQRGLRHFWEGWRIDHDEDHDYGAVMSVREFLADPEMIQANAWDDVVRQLRLLETAYSAALDTYLTGCDIDTSSLNDSMSNFHLHQGDSLNIKNVRNLNTGEHGVAGDHFFHHAPPGDTQPAGGTPGGSTSKSNK